MNTIRRRLNFTLAFAAVCMSSHLQAGVITPGASGWRPTPVQLGVGIQSHLDGIVSLLPSGSAGGINSPALAAALQNRITAPEASPSEVYAGLVLMQALTNPEHMASVKSYLQTSGPAQKAVIDGMTRWSSAMQQDSGARQSLMAALEPTKQALSRNGAFDLNGAAEHINALFDGSLGRQGDGLLAATGAPLAGDGIKAVAASRLQPHTPRAAADAPRPFKEVPAPGEKGDTKSAQVLKRLGDVASLTHTELINRVVELYPEMTWLTGEVHATPEGLSNGASADSPSQRIFGKQHIEFDRTANGVAFLTWVLGGKYDEFTLPQAAAAKMTRESFERMQRYTREILKTPEDIDAMITYMVINDLGKIDAIVKHVEKVSGVTDVDHDKILLVALKEHPKVSPSFQRLSDHHKQLILRGLEAKFNIGQFMQGENVPASLSGLSGLDRPSLDFYLLHALSDIAGAAGHVKAVGSVVMTESTYQNFQASIEALEGLAQGQSTKQAYDHYLANRAQILGLNITKPVDRAVARISLMLRASSPKQAEEVRSVFLALPKNVQAILASELNVSGVDDGIATLLYYSPATLANAISALKAAGDPEASKHGLEIGLTMFARLYQEARIATRNRQGNGVFTVIVSKVAEAAKKPLELNGKNIVLKPVGDDAEALLEDRKPIDSSGFPKMSSLSEIPGKRVGLIGIGGGSDVIQAAQLAQLLKGNNKEIPFVISIRTSKPTSQGSTNDIATARTIENPAATVADGVYRVAPNSSGSGRFLENLPADGLLVYLVLDSQDGSLASRIEAAMRHAGAAADTVLAVDTGGDALYSAQVAEGAKATPDQDFRVLKTLEALKRVKVMTVEIAAGVDSPPNAQEVLGQAHSKYYALSKPEADAVMAAYRKWKMDGSDDNRFGKTALAWQMAVQQQTGLQTLPIPSRVVIDRRNPWNPFVHVDSSMGGIFFMNLDDHLAAIGQKTTP